MITNETKVRVRYKETDQMGVVHHSNYAQYYEIGRTELLRQLGLTYAKMEKDGYMMPVIDLTSKFIASAYYDEELTIKTIVSKMPSIRTFFEYEIRNEKGELINTGSTTLVMVNKATRKPTKPSVEFMACFKSFDEQ